jgi:translation initiation factor 1 (eIF-1/SUI1)
VLLLVLISACSEKKPEVIEIEDKNFSDMLMIQKMEDNIETEEMNKIVRDKQKIEKILTMVEGIKVKEMDRDYVIERLKSKDSYSFSFAEGEKLESGKPIPYTFIIFNDGTLFFTNKDVNSNQQPRMAIEKHKDLLIEMKKLIKLDF